MKGRAFYFLIFWITKTEERIKTTSIFRRAGDYLAYFTPDLQLYHEINSDSLDFQSKEGEQKKKNARKQVDPCKITRILKVVCYFGSPKNTKKSICSSAMNRRSAPM